MKRIRKNRKSERTPHPDARIEAELQKILVLRRLADGYEVTLREKTEREMLLLAVCCGGVRAVGGGDPMMTEAELAARIGH